MANQELQALIDENEVKKLLIRLSYGMDERDAAKCRAVLADEVYCDFDPLDGVRVPAGPLSADLIVSETIRKLSHFQMTQHLNTMHLVDVSGDDAALTGYVIGSHYLGPDPSELGRKCKEPWSTIGARYDMKAHRFDRGWLFTSWTWRLMWTRDNDDVWIDVRQRMKAQSKAPRQ